MVLRKLVPLGPLLLAATQLSVQERLSDGGTACAAKHGGDPNSFSFRKQLLPFHGYGWNACLKSAIKTPLALSDRPRVERIAPVIDLTLDRKVVVLAEDQKNRGLRRAVDEGHGGLLMIGECGRFCIQD